MNRPYRLCRPDGRRVAYSTLERAVRAARSHAVADPWRSIVDGWGVYTVERRDGRRYSCASVLTFDGAGRMVERIDYLQTRSGSSAGLAVPA